MAYGEQLASPSLQRQFQTEETDLQGARGQLRGNLEWALRYFTPAEIIAVLAELHEDKISAPELSPAARLRFLRKKQQFHQAAIVHLEHERRRIREVINDD